jgi:hypothetical protein
MEETLTQPVQVQDDLPSLRSELGQWWHKHVKPFVDFKTFLRQRHQILSNSEVTHASQPPYAGWKNPFEFALSASTLTLAIVALIGIAFHTVFPDPDVKNDWIVHSLRAQLRAGASPAQRERILYDINDHITGLTIPHEAVFATAGAPLAVYFLGVLFPRFVRRKLPNAPYSDEARAIVYYYFTARTFWPAFLLVTGGSIYYFLLKYSLLNTYDEVVQQFPVTTGPLYLLLWALSAIGATVLVYAVIATPVAFHKCGRELPRVLGVQNDPHARREIYWGLMRSIILASLLAYVLAAFLIIGYMALDAGTQTVKTAIGASMSAGAPHS